MLTFTKTINAYSFGELSKKAKNKAIESDFISDLVYSNLTCDWQDLKNSIEVIGKNIGIYVENNNIYIDSELEGMEGRRFLKYILNRIDSQKEYTGVYTDSVFFDTVNKFIKLLKKGREASSETFLFILDNACRNFLNENESYYWSESYLEDAFNINEIFFDKNGNIIEVPAEVLKNL